MWWCYVDGSSSWQDKFSWQGWFSCTRVSNDKIMGSMNFPSRHLYMQNVKLLFGSWSVWRSYSSQRWDSLQNIHSWWRWYIYRHNNQHSHPKWRRLNYVRNSSLTFKSNIFGSLVWKFSPHTKTITRDCLPWWLKRPW